MIPKHFEALIFWKKLGVLSARPTCLAKTLFATGVREPPRSLTAVEKRTHASSANTGYVTSFLVDGAKSGTADFLGMMLRIRRCAGVSINYKINFLRVVRHGENNYNWSVDAMTASGVLWRC